jgi:LytS/YehU family sensor histidine kinase
LQIFFCYPFVYYFVFFYLQKRKYKEFIALLVLFLLSVYWITYCDFYYIWSDTSSPIFFNVNNVKPLNLFQTEYFSIYSNIHFTGSLVSCAIILSIKYYKNWYKKQRENEMLMKENSRAELQLLKAQVHPHFLFNTLNNIYSLTLDDSQKAAITVKKLSGMVLYMINEGAQHFVAVSKEIRMLLDYIGLEKIRYGDRLEMIIEIKHNPEDSLVIAPLLMIPFVENCFKHGASKTIDTARIELFIETGRDWLEFKISNSVPAFHEKENERIKIVLLNVQKRLQLLYPHKHTLDIQSSEKNFTVYMKLKLENPQPDLEQDRLSAILQPKLTYGY